MSSPLRTPQKLMTAEEFAELPEDGRRYELVRGVLVEMSRPQSHHGIVVGTVYFHLRNWNSVRRHGVLMIDVGHVVERGPDTVRGPDVALVRRDRLDLSKTSWVEGGPDLAVEVRSPGDRRGEIDERVADYLHAGTPLVWVVDPAKRTVVVRAPNAGDLVLGADAVLDGGDALPGFTVRVGELFEDLRPE